MFPVSCLSPLKESFAGKEGMLMKGSQRKQLLSPLSSPPPALQDKGAAGEVRDQALPMRLPAGFAAAAIGKPFRKKEPVFSKTALKLFGLRFLRGIPKFRLEMLLTRQ